MGKNEAIPYLPLNQWKQDTGRPLQFIKGKGKVCLTSEQASYAYKKVEKDSLM